MTNRFRITRSNIAAALVALACIASFVGCSSKPNQPGQEEKPAPEIKKPTSLKISSIEVSKFANKDWDASEFINAWKKADVWVSLGRKGAEPDYSSNTVFDASATSSHTYTKAGSLLGKQLPLTYSYVDNLVVTVWDYDVFTNEKIAAISVNPESIYQNDEATTFKASLSGSNSTKIIVRGQWIY